jgi:phage gp36-like protein
MPYLTKEDLKTRLYADVLDDITRTNDNIISQAIAAATQEAKMYLSRYDLTALLGTDTTAATIQDPLLKGIVTDLACWQLIRLANPSVDYATFRTAYQDAVHILTNIMKGNANPDGWPLKDTTVQAQIPKGDNVAWSSNRKRHNHF